jgi:tetratricopeptide (TPR) repeat protein
MTSHDPNHAAYLKGYSLWEKGRFKEASHFFSIAVDEWPEDYQALWALGDCYTELKKPRKAEAAFRQAMVTCNNADRLPLIFNLANALFDQQRYSEAIALYAEIPTSHHLSRAANRNAAIAQRRFGA